MQSGAVGGPSASSLTSPLASLLLRLGIKLSALIKLKQHWLWPISYAAVGPKCFGTSYDGTCLFLSFSLHAFIPLMHSINLMLSDFTSLSWKLLLLYIFLEQVLHFSPLRPKIQTGGCFVFVCWFPELNSILLALKVANIVVLCLLWLKYSCVAVDSHPQPTW